jgi:hypothetical protein
VNRFLPAFALALGVLLLGLTAPQARADVNLTVSLSFESTGTDSVSVSPGDTPTLDIKVSSSSSYTLSQFGLELQITMAPSADLFFTPTATGTPNDMYPSTRSDYVFAGSSSLNSGTPPLFIGTPFWLFLTPPVTPNDAIGGDTATDSMGGASYVTLSGSSAFLASMTLTAAAGATSNEQFTVSLIPQNFAGNPGDNTFFLDKDGNSLNYSSNTASVTILGQGGQGPPAVVPEPASTITSLTGAALFTAYGLLRLRRSRRPSFPR